MPPKINRDLFTDDKEHELIREVEKRPILWDCNSKVFRRADLKPALWVEVALALGGAPFTGDMVAHRWKNMKDTFLSNWNRVLESKNRSSGNGTDDMHKPKWPLYDRLTFLKGTVATEPSFSNIYENDDVELSTAGTAGPVQPVLDISSISNRIETDGTDNSVFKIYYDEATKTWSTEKSDTSNSSTGSTPAQPHGTSPVPSATDVKKGVRDNEIYAKRGAAKRKASTLMEEAVQAVKQLASQPMPNFSEEVADTPDTAHHFGMFVAGRLRDMERDSRKECEKEVMSVLFKY
ncbi:hypothetical protein FOCC_FOCC007312 [Frankliniella occidentalis]|uniref:Uncharacterized protein LOC113213082 n=1 Tax=Frankliniella occidentalis TaxID=133901 RepID=A0A6J1T813_FRAOC|nr:uncharacterized protein LOC113213082 [Frankliniella occidentalis]KAE8745951.1 hypothetical protein FOCC_FOCC007312 [Frankliniella occidentalis]